MSDREQESSNGGVFKGETLARLEHLEAWVKDHGAIHDKIQDKLDVVNRWQGALVLLVVSIPILLKVLWPSK